jgi:hypothetical protein
MGFLNDRTHSLTASFGFIALAYVAPGSLVLSLRIRCPEDGSGACAVFPVVAYYRLNGIVPPESRQK